MLTGLKNLLPFLEIMKRPIDPLLFTLSKASKPFKAIVIAKLYFAWTILAH